jgi:hypothetical protein
MRMPIALCLLVLFFASPQLRAQENQPRWFLGVVGGYNADYHSGTTQFFTFGDIPGLNSWPTPAANGNGNGIILGLAGEYLFTNDGSTSLQFKLYYERKPGIFNWNGTHTSYYDSTTNQLYDYYQRFEVDATYDLFNIEILYKYNIPFLSHAGISIGPKFGIVTGSSYTQYSTLYPSFRTFPDGASTEYLLPKEDIPGAIPYHLGVKLGAQYEILLDRFLITPAISYDYGITKIVSSWQVNTLAGTVDVKYGL